MKQAALASLLIAQTACVVAGCATGRSNNRVIHHHVVHHLVLVALAHAVVGHAGVVRVLRAEPREVCARVCHWLWLHLSLCVSVLVFAAGNLSVILLRIGLSPVGECASKTLD